MNGVDPTGLSMFDVQEIALMLARTGRALRPEKYVEELAEAENETAWEAMMPK